MKIDITSIADQWHEPERKCKLDLFGPDLHHAVDGGGVEGSRI